MMERVSSSKPTWQMHILAWMRLIDLPRKVNCWYCNENSYVYRGDGQTENHWRCRFCENTNIRDENGEIVDNPHPPYNATDPRPVSPCFKAITHSARSTSSTRSTLLCPDCLKNEEMIYELASKYICDENDPRYEYYNNTAEEYRKSLNERYPLCDACQTAVDAAVSECQMDLQYRRVGEKLARSLTTKLPKRTPRYQYLVEGLFWALVHISILLISLYAHHYPPSRQSLSVEGIITDIIMAGHACVMFIDYVTSKWQRYSFTGFISYLLISTVKFSITSISNTTYFLADTLQCVLPSPEPVEINCNWNISYYLTPILILYGLSYLWMLWHPVASKSFVEETFRFTHWTFYKNVQKLLYVLRLALLGAMFVVKEDTVLQSVMKVGGLMYLMCLVGSVSRVRLARSQLHLRKVGRRINIGDLKKSYSDMHYFALQTAEKVSKISQRSLDAARYLQPQFSQDRNSNLGRSKSESSRLEYDVDDVAAGISRVSIAN